MDDGAEGWGWVGGNTTFYWQNKQECENVYNVFACTWYVLHNHMTENGKFNSSAYFFAPTRTEHKYCARFGLQIAYKT